MATNGLERPLDVVIIGGGITGIVLAVALAKKGMFARIYEAKSRFNEIGAAVAIGPNAVRILQRLGVVDDMVQASGEKELSMLPLRYKYGMGDHETIYEYPRRPGDVGHGLARGDFIEAMAKHVDPKHTHFNKRCVNVVTHPEDPSRSKISFSDGTTTEADVVLIADGIRSAARSAVTGKPSEESLAYSGKVCYRALVPAAHAHAAGLRADFHSRPVCVTGPDKHLIIVYIKGGQLINIAAFDTDRSFKLGTKRLPPDQPTVVPSSAEEFLQTFQDFGDGVRTLLSCATGTNKWYINVLYPHLATFVKGRIALVGDAAHAMPPHLGAGAGQCIEDAYVLSELLANPETNQSNIEDVLRAYDEVRRPRAQFVWDESWRQGDNNDFRGENGPTFEGLRKDVADIWDAIWHYPTGEDTRKAILYLQELGIYRK